MTANSSEDKQRKFREWRSLDCLREEIDTNKVIDNWVTPLENYRDSSESGDSHFDPVLCEFGEFTRLMLWYYSVLTTGLFPHLTESIDAESVKKGEDKVREALTDAATRLLKTLNTES